MSRNPFLREESILTEEVFEDWYIYLYQLATTQGYRWSVCLQKRGATFTRATRPQRKWRISSLRRAWSQYMRVVRLLILTGDQPLPPQIAPI